MLRLQSADKLEMGLRLSQYRMKLSGLYKATLIVILALLVEGCLVTPQPLTEAEVQSRVVQDLDALTKNQELVTRPIGLYEAMARALKYNLDTRVEVMKTMLAHQNLDLSHYELLPDVVANGAYNKRSNFSGGTSISLLDGQESLEPSTSSEKDVFSADLSLSWDVLDFGLSYIRAKQAADDVLIADEERRRVAIRLIQEVRDAYWRAVSAERMLPQLKFLDAWIDDALQRSKIIQEEKLDSPLVPLQQQRELIENQYKIQQLYRELATAKIRLASLMNLHPGQYYELEIPDSETTTPELDLPLDEMVRTALLNRPELRTVDYRKRINAKETKAAILELLPHVNLEYSRNYNSNDLLFNQNWIAYGAKVSWNLVNLFRQPAKFQKIEAQQKVLEAQGLALTMAIMTQVHVGMAQVIYAKKEFLTARRYYETQTQIIEQTRRSWIANRSGIHRLIQEKVNGMLAQLRHDAAKANLESAHARLLAGMGEDPLPEMITGLSVADLAKTLRAHWLHLNGI